MGSKVKTYAPKHALRLCARWSVERLQQYSVKYCADLYNLQLTSDVCNILISPHIVIRALDYNGSTIPRLVNRRSGWWMVGRAVKFLGVVSGWNIIAWARTSGAPRLRLFRIHGEISAGSMHRDSEAGVIVTVNKCEAVKCREYSIQYIVWRVYENMWASLRIPE